MAILTTCIYVSESVLYRTPDGGGLKVHSIKGFPHCQEYERLAAFICMLFGVSKLAAPIYRDTLQFSTTPMSNGAAVS